MLFGDYDVDGVTSLALLSTVLSAYGCAPALFLPLRMEEGYGLTTRKCRKMSGTHQPKLLIAVDCGTASVAEIDHLTQEGVDVIVLDHHEPKSALPNCVALVNPKTAPTRLSTTSAALASSLNFVMRSSNPVRSRILICAHSSTSSPWARSPISFRWNGKTAPSCSGVLSRSRERAVRPAQADGYSAVRGAVLPEHIGFRLGPRLNAAGRLSTAEKALRLLLTRIRWRQPSLAEDLDRENRDRQAVEKEIFAAAEKQLAQTGDPVAEAAIVAGAPGWHPGVLGIVASRIARKYHRPTIVIGFDREASAKAVVEASKDSRWSRRSRPVANGWINTAATKWRPASATREEF